MRSTLAMCSCSALIPVRVTGLAACALTMQKPFMSAMSEMECAAGTSTSSRHVLIVSYPTAMCNHPRRIGSDGGPSDPLLKKWWRGRMGMDKADQQQFFDCGCLHDDVDAAVASV